MANNKLYVGNLPYKTTQQDLQELFSQFGEITEAVVISDKFSGRSKGFGFVEFSTEESAQQAVEALDGKEYEDRQLKVNVARPREERPPRQ